MKQQPLHAVAVLFFLYSYSGLIGSSHAAAERPSEVPPASPASVQKQASHTENPVIESPAVPAVPELPVIIGLMPATMLPGGEEEPSLPDGDAWQARKAALDTRFRAMAAANAAWAIYPSRTAAPTKLGEPLRSGMHRWSPNIGLYGGNGGWGLGSTWVWPGYPATGPAYPWWGTGW